jgi:preprotein translocase subunit SecE
VAERRRRGEDPADDRRDEDALADDALDDAIDDELIDEDDTEDDDVDSDARSGVGGTATKTRQKPSSPAGKKSTKGKSPERRPGIFARIVNFIREVVAELRKVIWPTRKELITYTTVVVVFVVVMLTIVGLLDYGFAKAVLWVFGNGTTSDSK